MKQVIFAAVLMFSAPAAAVAGHSISTSLVHTPQGNTASVTWTYTFP